MAETCTFLNDAIVFKVPLVFNSTATFNGANAPYTKTETNTLLNAKQATITGGATTIATSNLTASRALVSDTSGKVAVSAVTNTELGYLSGVSSPIQAQIDKALTGLPYYSGCVQGPGTIRRYNGFYSFSVQKFFTGLYSIIFGTAMPNGQYTVLATARNTVPIFVTYSSPNTGGVTISVYDISGAAVDCEFSFTVTYS